MNRNALALISDQLVSPWPLVALVFAMFTVTMIGRMYSLKLVLRDSKPADRPAILREYRQIWRFGRRK
ncbi:hypothetical protein ACN20G_29960 (plasmid) [Streptomyces sp. BI20]|uniref:hypothetical protein n=1 Tax=Streptomyces sp. BI20 TaxID=3403460 RepID=UPI003C7578A8